MLLATGCAYSPPLRTPSYGAPGRLREGQLELAGGVAGAALPFAGGARVGYGVRDWAAVEGAVDLADGWAMGSLGGRFTRAPGRDRRFHGALDGELGVGAGAGGSQRSGIGVKEPPWWQVAALGAYVGGGAGYHLGIVALWARGRVQASAADGAPSTLYGAANGGIQVRVAERFDVHASGGVFGVHNRETSAFVPLWDFGVSYYFTLGRRRAAEPATAPPAAPPR